MTPNLPAGTVTFLFMDIEGSASLWEREPHQMRAALARHDVLLQAAAAAHDGQVYKVVGDAVQAAFALPAQAVAAALAAQRGLAAETWPTSWPIRVRMGLHTGPAEPAGADYATTHTLNRVARIMAAGHGGQILLSVETANLVRGDLPADVTLRDLAQHRMKGLAQLEHLFQVVAPDLPAGFPPLASAAAIPNNLPIQLTSFVGREKEIAEVKGLLAETRLLTLTGPGGTGKTRLALQIAADVWDAFPDGVWLVELAPLSDPALVPLAVAATWGVREQPGRPLAESLSDYLRPKTILLILDNCEHVIDACAHLATALLRACPQLRILSSSREALGVTGETAYRVPSLSLPDPHQPLSMESFTRYEATRLFVERAQAAQPRFAATAQNLGAVAQICQRLDGIPLALELAAARVKLLTVEQIVARLDDRFRLLTGGSRTALPRQQTLRALIDWSYDLLPTPERRALGRLSVFAGGWTLEAAEAILGPDTLDLLASLVDKSLVVTEERGAADGTRYRLLETIRQYARDKLWETGEAPVVRDLHLHTYLRLATHAEPRLDGPEMVQALNQLETEVDNMRAALEWGLERDAAAALQLAVSLKYFWQRRGLLTEGYRWLQDSLSRCAASPPAAGATAVERLALRAKACLALGTLAFALGDLHAARSWLEEGAVLGREHGEPKTLVRTLSMLGFTASWQGDAAASEAVFAEGLSIARATGDAFSIASMLAVGVDRTTRFRGDFATAHIYAEEALGLLRQVGNPWFIAMSVLGLGMQASLEGNYAAAQARFEESRALFREMGDRQMANGVQSEWAHIERRLGHYEQALALYAETILGWQELGQRAALAHELECFAFIACARSQAQRAARLFGAAEGLRQSGNLAMRDLERLEYDQAVSALRGQLGQAAFATAWAVGRALTMDQAIAYALETN